MAAVWPAWYGFATGFWLGAAILAMVGAGVYPDVKTACEDLIRVSETVEPDPEQAALYQERYEKFSQIYPACKALFKKLV